MNRDIVIRWTFHGFSYYHPTSPQYTDDLPRFKDDPLVMTFTKLEADKLITEKRPYLRQGEFIQAESL